jgi:hypothetical protein
MSGKLNLDELRKRAQAAARDLNEKYDIRSKLDRGAQVAEEAVRKTVDIASSAASSAVDAAREGASRIDQEGRVSERAREATRAAGQAYENSGVKEKVDQAASSARTKASEAYEKAKEYYQSASTAARATTSAARLPSSVITAIKTGAEWVKNNPGKAAVVSLALSAGTRAGAAFSSLDAVILGSGGGGNWLFHSAVIPYGLRRLSEKYEVYLQRQEELLKEGKLDDAARERVEFERNVAKYVGAPLLGAFSIAVGAGMVVDAVSGGAVTGFPINLVLGNNPLLSGIWLFGNGLICFHSGYKFFMIALANQEDVERVIKDIKGLLPVGG